MTAAAAVVGVLVGLHAASWGAYKDALFEGFRLASYLRSIVLAAIIAGLVASLAPQLAPGVVLLIGTVYAIERLATEGRKAILREQDQDRYTTPMRLGFRVRPVDDNLTRYVVGATVAPGALAGFSSFEAVQHRLPSPPSLLVLLAVGSAGGWATAVGGAWKDAPIEGFSGWKFLRSPAVATAWAVPLSFSPTAGPPCCSPPAVTRWPASRPTKGFSPPAVHRASSRASQCKPTSPHCADFSPTSTPRCGWPSVELSR